MQNKPFTLHTGDSLEVLRGMPENSVDAVVTDPPYGLRFMGNKWDYGVPTTELWTEVLRVLKPGGHLLAFAGTRTQHRMAVRIEDAGFEIRDMIAWVYGSGFPKSLNVQKAINREAGETTGAAIEWAGWGTALKPALEPITLARKPFSQTVAANVLEWSTGAMNIDGCRVEAEASTGRWPANLIHDGSEEVVGLFPQTKSGGGEKGAKRHTNVVYGHCGTKPSDVREPDKGSAARFFYCAKTSPSERKVGVETNDHPTVKPTALMSYLCRLVTPPGGVILDPFMGSGSTGRAAMLEGFQFVGVDLNPDFVELSRARIQHALDQSKQGALPFAAE